MLKNITIGQYYKTCSPLHSLDARVKIILTIFYLAVVFIIKSGVSYVIAAVFTAAVMAVSKVPVRYFLKGLRPVMWILLFMAVINLFTIKGEPLITLPFSLTITREGVSASVLISVRLILLVLGASLLTLTTPPLSLTDGIESLLSPLEAVKVPAHDIAMMMSVAIRFIPVFSEEADRIKKAQSARGADFESGGIIKRAKVLLPIFVPLFVSAFRRADMLGEAMDARCYCGKGRTRMKEQRFTLSDASAAAVFAIFAAVVITAEFVFEF